MILTTRQRLLGLLLASALAACSGKKEAPASATAQPAADNAAATRAAPAAPVAALPADAAAAGAAPADAAGALAEIAKKASLDCDDRTIVLEASCTDLNGPRVLACTRQSLSVLDRASGAAKSTRQFAPQPAQDGDPPLVEEKVGTLACARAGTGERYIVASMYNGGNCEQCEWHEAYDWDGKLVASDRDRSKPDTLMADLLAARKQKPDAIIASKELTGFYSALPQQ